MAKEQPGLTSLPEAKRWLRRHLTGVRQSIDEKERARLSARVAAAFTRSPDYRRARTVALFIGFGSEVATGAIVRHAWEAGKDVLIPITADGFHKPYFAHFRKGELLKKTPFGPLELFRQSEPFDMKKVDMVVVPGLGFDDRGHRLGYGGGVYDRLLVKTPRARHVGLFFSCQRVHAIPRADHDRPLSAIVTENGIFPTETHSSGLA